MNTTIKYLILPLLLAAGVAQAQNKDVPVLFQASDPLSAELSFSFRDVKKNKIDSVYFPATLKFNNGSGRLDSMQVEVRARGNFRRENCFFPPLRLKIKKNAAQNTVFQGNKSLKLVLPCKEGKDANHLIMKEYLGYQLYEPITQYIFHTRLVNITLYDRSAKKPKAYSAVGFFIEDDDLVADRFKGKITEATLHPLQLEDSAAVKHDLFQYMISNTDWSSVASHNVKVLQLKPGHFVPLAYDFDMSGLVNPPYGQVSPLTGQQSVRDRVYRGFCRKPELVEAVRQIYLAKQSELTAVINRHAPSFTKPQLDEIQSYMEGFYNTLKNDKQFKNSILDACRKN